MESSGKWRQFVIGSLANFTSISLGIYSSWTSPVVPKLADKSLKDSPLGYPISETSVEAGWISSLISLSAGIGPFIVWQLIDKIGRKNCILISGIFYLIANILLIFTTSLWMINVSRFLQGIGVAFGMVAIPIYQVEISSDDCRGAIGSLYQLFMLAGTSYILVIGPVMSYKLLHWVCIPFPILCIITIWFIPETPYYYIMKGRFDEARKSLKFLRGKSDKLILNELQIIQDTIEKSILEKASVTDLFTNKINRKAFIISFVLIFIQQFCGSNVIYVNTQSVFETSESFDITHGMIIVSIANMLAGVVALFVVDHFGRRITMLFSSIFMGISMIGLGSFYYVQAETGDITNIKWIPITCLIIFLIAYSLGFGTVPWIYITEVFPANIKSLASSIMVSVCWLLTFFVTLWFPALSAYGVYYIFWGFGVVCIFSWFFVYYFVCETKGLSLKDIQILINS